MISLVSSLPAVLVVKVVGYPSGNQTGKLFLSLSNNFLSFWSRRWSEPLSATKPGSFMQNLPAVLVVTVVGYPSGNQTGKLHAKTSGYFGREGSQHPFRQPNWEASCKTFRLPTTFRIVTTQKKHVNTTLRRNLTTTKYGHTKRTISY